MMFEVTLAQKISAWLLPVLLAITVHETAHGWIASYFGDQTAKMLGRHHPGTWFDVVITWRFCFRLGKTGAG